MDTAFANAIAFNFESGLFGSDRLSRMIEAQDIGAVFAIAKESGFGEGVDGSGIDEIATYERNKLNEFIKEYCPTNGMLVKYFLADIDFVNAESVLKARYLNVDVGKMFQGGGTIGLDEFNAYFDVMDADANRMEDVASVISQISQTTVATTSVSKEIIAAMHESLIALREGLDPRTVSIIFSKCETTYRAKVVPMMLRFLERRRVDCKNILTTFRANDFSEVESMYLFGGKIHEVSLQQLFEHGENNAMSQIPHEYDEFIELCRTLKDDNSLQIEAENIIDSDMLAHMEKYRFMPKGKSPFILYVLEKLADISNFRILASGKLANLSSEALKKRVRRGYEF